MSADSLGHRLHEALATEDPDRLAALLRDPRARLPVPDVTDRARWDGIEPDTRAALLAEADDELRTPLPVLLASDWARNFRDGVRIRYEDVARALRERTTRLVLAAVLTGQVADAGADPGAAPYLDGAADALNALAETSTWCWAPHEHFAAARHEVVPDPDDPFLGLGAAETGSLLAWAHHVLGPHLDIRVPGLTRRLRREVELRVLGPFERRHDWHWIGADGSANNWNPWIHGGVLACALLLPVDGSRRARLMRRVIDGLDHYVATLPADGGIDEGIAYWWQGACRLMEALDLLAAADGAELDAREHPVLAALARFPYRMHLGADWYVNAGDAAARLPDDQPWHVLFDWAGRIGDPRVRAHAVASGRRAGPAHPVAGLGRALIALADRDWRRALADTTAHDEGSWLESEVWLPGVQILVAREHAGSAAGLALAAKAGHNGEHHNHLDVGSYWVALDGHPAVVDVGRPTYTAGSFGPDRYRAWPVGSGWHNVPEPGAAQQPGRGHGARSVRTELDPDRAGLSCELTAVYPPGQVGDWRRTVRLVRATATGPARAYVEDRWAAAPSTVLLHHVLAGDVTLEHAGALVRLDEGRALRLSWDPSSVTAGIEHRSLHDPVLRRSWGGRLTRLTLRVAGAADGGRLTVRMERAG